MPQASPNTTERRAYTIVEFCDAYRIGRTKLWQLVKAGELLTKLVGRRVLIDAASAETWYAGLPTSQGKAA